MAGFNAAAHSGAVKWNAWDSLLVILCSWASLSGVLQGIGMRVWG